MTAERLIEQLRRRGFQLRVVRDTLQVAPPAALTAADRVALREALADVKALLRAEANLAPAPEREPGEEKDSTPAADPALDPSATARTQREGTRRSTGLRPSVATRTVFVSGPWQVCARCGGTVWLHADGVDDECAACTPDDGHRAAHHPGGEGSR